MTSSNGDAHPASPTGEQVHAALEELASCRRPYVIGVRHHSPALATVVPELLDAAGPEVLFVELPAELGEWLPWLSADGTVAPVALSAASEDGSSLAFYPFADFSPELAAIRWARRNNVEVVACDLPLGYRGEHRIGVPEQAPLATALRRASTGRTDDDLWDRIVEAAAPGQAAESVRRAALLVGWALRQDAEGSGVDPYDLRRESWMVRRIREAGSRRSAAVIGSFHAAALLPAATEPAAPTPDPAVPRTPVVTSLVPYLYSLLDERSGYPAGIRDPEWQQAVLEAAGDPAELERAAVGMIVRVCAGLRARGHPAGPGEARETVRLALDLARLRRLPAPGRGELIEAMQSVLTHAEPVGRGRIVARVAEEVLVGRRTGVLAPGTPRSGLAPAVEALLAELRLPGPAELGEQRELRLDAFRSRLDCRRQVTLWRLHVLGIPYGTPEDTVGIGDAEALTARWTVGWTPATAATLPAVGMWGVTLFQAAQGRLRAQRAREMEAGGSTAAQVLASLRAAADCGLATLVGERLTEAAIVLPSTGTLSELLAGLDLADRLHAGHLPGLPPDALDAAALSELAGALETAAVGQLDGMTGSDDIADARALVGLGQRQEALGGGLRLAAALRRLADGGSPLMQGAAGATRVLLDLDSPRALGERAASWLDTATTPEARQALRRRLTGVLAAANPLMETSDAITPLMERVESLPDKDFLDRLPSLRGAFREVGPAARERVLAAVRERVGDRVDLGLDAAPEHLAAWITADHTARAALSAHGLDLPAPSPTTSDTASWETRHTVQRNHELSVTLRWRLILARHGDRPAGAARYACALDELYGAERGEGASAGLYAGRETSFPDVREWSQEVEALFGPGIREEVLAAAVESGRLDAAMELNPDAVRPSVDLLRNVLSLAGGLPESALARLRPLVAKLVEELTAQLASQLRPALTGLQLPRPSRRPSGRLDLNRTLRANLATARRRPDGGLLVIPERPVFRTRARRSSDWRLVLVVDVSGSMEASTIWAALTAAVFAHVPALTTHFLAFSTDVIDLSDRVADPLSLLLEVRVGGGTHIAAGLRHARSLVTVPERTLVAVISDFEEGYPLGGLLAQARELVAAGVRLIGCASLDDKGTPRYSVPIAQALVALGMPVAALSPQELARWVGDQIR